MRLGGRLILAAVVLGTAARGQLSGIVSGIQSIVSDVTSVGGDVTSGAESIFTIVVSYTSFGRESFH